MNHICRAIIVAAGRGRRMGSDIPKQFIELDARPIIVHTLLKFASVEDIEDITVVIADEYMEYMQRDVLDRYKFNKPVALVTGEEERQKSVYNGIKALPDDTDIVIVHDGVRPFIDIELIEKSISIASSYGAAVVGVPVKDTIKRVSEGGYICETMNRDCLWAVQTPQTFRYDIILEAHRRAIEDGFMGTDDSVLVERLGGSVNMIMGNYNNMKITTREDLIIAKAILDDLGGGR